MYEGSRSLETFSKAITRGVVKAVKEEVPDITVFSDSSATTKGAVHAARAEIEQDLINAGTVLNQVVDEKINRLRCLKPLEMSEK
jgi:hypothetical protein